MREVFANGLTAVVRRDPAAPVAAIVTHVKAGYFDEPDQWVGISHVLEHMYFKGTARRGVGEIPKLIKAAGGYINAGTSYDQTQFYAVLPAGELAVAAEVQADALRGAAIDAVELDRELEVIIQESKRKLDTPSAVVLEALYATLFDVHRIRRWRIGTEEGLRRLRREDVVRFYRSRYVPRRTIVAVVGDVDPAQALDVVRRHFAGIPDEPAEENPSPAEPDHAGFRLRVLSGDVAQMDAVLGWRTVPALHSAMPALDVAAAVLGSGRGSLAYRRLRETGLASRVSASHFTPTEIGVFIVELGVPVATRLEALAGAWEAVRTLSDRGPTADELARARALIAAQWTHRFETMEGQATALAEFEALGGYALADKLYGRTLAATSDEIAEACRRFLSLERGAVAAYLPPGVDLADAASLEGALAGVHTTVPVVHAQRRSPPARRARRGEPVRTEDGCLELALAGADLLTYAKPGAPLVTLGVFVPGVPAAETATDAGLALLAARTALRGIRGADATALAYETELLGGVAVSAVTRDWAGWTLSVPAEHCAAAAGLLADVALEPTLDRGAVETERTLQLDEIRRARDDMFRYPFELALRAAFDGDAYGLPLHGTAESVGGLSREAVRRWFEAVRSRRALVVAVGELGAERVLEVLAGAFDRWPGRRRVAVRAAPRFAPGVCREERDKAQTALAIALPGVARGDDRRYALQVLAAVATGLGGRLFERLRDQRSLAYTVMLQPWLRARAGAVIAYIATSPGREAEARVGLLQELEALAREPLTPDELNRAKRYLCGMEQVSRQTGAGVLAHLVTTRLTGAAVRSLEGELARFVAVRDEEVAECARAVAMGPRAEGLVAGRT